MDDNVIDVEEIPEKGITVTSVVIDGLIETSIQRSDALLDRPDIAILHKPISAGDPRMQHDLAVRDVYAGKYGDFSEQSRPKIAPVPGGHVSPEGEVAPDTGS
jgi:hypothetical protein